MDPFAPQQSEESQGLFSDPDNRGDVISDWVKAPDSSHVLQFRLIDRSASEVGSASEIWVTFKGGGKTHRPPSTYTYTIASHDTARSIFEELKTADHPGSVVDEKLKKPRYPYSGPFYQ